MSNDNDKDNDNDNDNDNDKKDEESGGHGMSDFIDGTAKAGSIIGGASVLLG